MSSIYVIGYPDIVSDSGVCALNVHLNQAERAFTRELLLYINKTIRSVAESSGLKYIDISQALQGHRLCETASHNVAVNGLTSGKDSGIFGFKFLGGESYHPNALGHRLIEQTILQKTNNLTSRQTSVEDTPSKLTEQPRSGRPVNTFIPAQIIEKPVIPRNTSLSFKVDGASFGLVANSAYKTYMGANKILVNETLSDTEANLDVSMVVPPDTEAGSSSIQIIGTNQSGNTIVIWQPVIVEDRVNDPDGDGIESLEDDCPLGVNSGKDEDKDGVDDSCDAYIDDSAPSTKTTQLEGTPLPTNKSTALNTHNGPMTGATTIPPKTVAIIGALNYVPQNFKIQNAPQGTILGTVQTKQSLKPHLLATRDVEATAYKPKIDSYLWITRTLLVVSIWWLILLLILLWLVFKYKRVSLQWPHGNFQKRTLWASSNSTAS